MREAIAMMVARIWREPERGEGEGGPRRDEGVRWQRKPGGADEGKAAANGKVPSRFGPIPGTRV